MGKLFILLQLGLVLYSFVAFSNEKSGNCLHWTMGDAAHLLGCMRSTKENCMKWKSLVAPDNKIKSELNSLSDSIEFDEKKEKSCIDHFVESARGAEISMTAQWGYVVYSENLREGQKASVYLKSCHFLEKPIIGSKTKENLMIGTEVTIIKKSKERASCQGKNKEKARWFEVKNKTFRGYICGAYLHPDPSHHKEFI